MCCPPGARPYLSLETDLPRPHLTANDNLIRSTTLPGTQTSIRFSSELAVEVVFSTAEVPNEVRIGTFYRKPVLISSCWCMLKFLTLPGESERSVFCLPGWH